METINLCSCTNRKCEGICPQKRLERGQKGVCPAFHVKTIKKVVKEKNYNDEDLYEKAETF